MHKDNLLYVPIMMFVIYQTQCLFLSVTIALRILLTILVTTAYAEFLQIEMNKDCSNNWED